VAQRLRRLPCYLTVDVEQGFSDDPGEVAAFVAALPADGINLEDGMKDTKVLCRKISAIKAAAPHVFLNARTDTYWQRAGSVDETRRRLDAYLEAGADGVFVPGVQDPAAISALVAAGGPLNVLLSPDGLSLAHLAELGVARVSTGSLLFRLALGSLRHWATGEAGTPGYAEVAAWAD
jgi:2-methylisocitrate lyase-like PEP mutase family enzyme